MRHHYIPQFYLRQWLGADFKLQEFRRGYEGRIQTGRYGTLSTGYVDDLYALAGVSDRLKHEIERLFMGPVDTAATIARDLLLQGEIPQGEMRACWARFLLSLLTRTPEQIAAFKAKVAADWKKPQPEMRERYLQVRRPEWPEDFEEMMLSLDPALAERTAIILATKMMQNQKTLQLLMSAMWWVLDISQLSNQTFMTSDHPLIMTNGLGRDDGHFALPIGPRHLFIGFMNHDISHSVRGLKAERIVNEVNKLVIGQGRKYVYASDATELDNVRTGMGKLYYMTLLSEDI